MTREDEPRGNAHNRKVYTAVRAREGAHSDPVDAAVARSREAWRRGELFTGEQVREYRERYGRMKSHGVIWKGYRGELLRP